MDGFHLEIQNKVCIMDGSNLWLDECCQSTSGQTHPKKMITSPYYGRIQLKVGLMLLVHE